MDENQTENFVWHEKSEGNTKGYCYRIGGRCLQRETGRPKDKKKGDATEQRDFWPPPQNEFSIRATLQTAGDISRLILYRDRCGIKPVCLSCRFSVLTVYAARL